MEFTSGNDEALYEMDFSGLLSDTGLLLDNMDVNYEHLQPLKPVMTWENGDLFNNEKIIPVEDPSYFIISGKPENTDTLGGVTAVDQVINTFLDNSEGNITQSDYSTCSGSSASPAIEQPTITYNGNNLVTATIPNTIQLLTFGSSESIDESVTPAKPKRVRRKKTEHKQKMYEIETPFQDEKMEKKRRNAIKARKNREKQGMSMKELKSRNDQLTRELNLLRQKDNNTKMRQQTHDQQFQAIINTKNLEIQNLKNKIKSLSEEKLNFMQKLENIRQISDISI